MSDNYEARVNSMEEDVDDFDDSYFADLSNFNDGDNEGDVENDDDNFLDIYNLTPKERFIHQIKKSSHKVIKHYQELSLWQRLLVSTVGVCIFILGVLFLIFHNVLLHKVVETSNELEENRATPFVLMLLIFCVAFPPMIGFSLLSTITGLVYGVSFEGWIILSVGAVLGSVCSFALFKTILHSQAERLVHSNRRFEAFASILQGNSSYWILALLRLCPFPYSLTNGAIAAVYGLTLRNFAIAQVITTPKLLIYLFIGSRIKNIGETDSTSSKLVDLISIIVAIVILTLTAWILYSKTQKKYSELQRQHEQIHTDDSTLFDPSFDV